MERGWIAEKDTVNVPTWDEYKGAVTKTQEYAYDDYAVALVAKELGDEANYKLMMERSNNYKTLFDPSTGFWRGKIDDGSWIQDFDPYYPYYQYMYREANAWNALFFAPHDPEGMIKLYPCISQLVGTHVIVVVHQTVKNALGFLLFVYEIIGVRNAVSRLVSVAIVSDESGQVVGLVTSPRFAE